MQKSFVVKSAINFANFGFFVRIGDILLHDTANGNKLTIYRGGEIVKAITQTSLGMAALLKQGFIAEVAQPSPAAATPPRASEAPRKASPAPTKAASPASKSKPKPEPKPEPESKES